MGLPGRYHAIVGWVVGSVAVIGTFGALLIENSVGMHAVVLGSLILEKNLNGISDLGVQSRAKKAKVFPLQRALLRGSKGRVGVFVIYGFAIDLADSVLPLFCPKSLTCDRAAFRSSPQCPWACVPD